ncbi:hypothetical protein BSL78_26781 [Apostichopus japonicus]|uniref:RWD domain-containing protein n=1 Tax=Stichopus japonicus TaxID=307972 RepID=A0A2G8JKX3_STIJA|nr:hypothetical protein BSL78_26781 [Apostichopus japonicus]
MAEQLGSSASFKMPSRLSEDLKEELNAIASIYSGKDEVIVLETTATTKDGHVTIQVSPDQCICKVIFTLSEDYPAKPPARIEVSEKDTWIKRLPDDTLQTILQTLYQAAQECLGNPMIFTLVEKFKEQLQEHSGKDGQGVENG